MISMILNRIEKQCRRAPEGRPRLRIARRSFSTHSRLAIVIAKKSTRQLKCALATMYGDVVDVFSAYFCIRKIVCVPGTDRYFIVWPIFAFPPNGNGVSIAEIIYGCSLRLLWRIKCTSFKCTLRLL